MKFDRSPRYLVHLDPRTDVFLDDDMKAICLSTSMAVKGDYPVVYDVIIGHTLDNSDTVFNAVVKSARQHSETSRKEEQA